MRNFAHAMRPAASVIPMLYLAPSMQRVAHGRRLLLGSCRKAQAMIIGASLEYQSQDWLVWRVQI